MGKLARSSENFRIGDGKCQTYLPLTRLTLGWLDGSVGCTVCGLVDDQPNTTGIHKACRATYNMSVTWVRRAVEIQTGDGFGTQGGQNRS
jgi:hypothetical protein